MKIKNRLYMSAGISIILVVILISLVVVTSGRIAEENKEHVLLTDVRGGIAELDIVTYDYLLHREKRMEQQWHLKYNSLAEILDKVAEEEAFKSIRADYAALGDLFSQVTANNERIQKLIGEGASQEKIDTALGLEERLVAQLLITSHSVITDASRLAEEAQAEVMGAQRLAANLTLILMIILAITVTTASLLVARSISKPLDELTKGAEIIGKGELEHKVGVKSKDELGQLAAAFNKMTESLKEVTASRDELDREVTERKQAEEALRESEERFRALTESTSDWVWEVDANGVYTYASPKVRDLLGYEPEEVIGKTPFDLMPPEEAKRIAEEFRAIVESQRPFAGLENTNLHKDGRLVVLETSGVPIFGAEGQLCGYRGIDRDITRRKQAEQALQMRTHALGERVKELNCLCGISSLVEKEDISLEEIFQGVVDLIPPAWQYPEVTCARITIGDKEFKTDNFKTTEWKQTANIRIKRRKEGTVEVYYLQGRPDIDEGPFLTEERALIESIAEELGRTIQHKRAEEEVKRSRDYLEKLTDSMWDAVFHVKMPERVIEWANDSFRITGYEPEECIGKTTEFLYPDEKGFFTFGDKLKSAIAEGKDIVHTEQLLKKKNGEVFPAEITATIFKEKGEVVRVTSIVRDVTERKKLDQLKEDFIGLVSHELRSPLTVITGAVNTALTEGARLSPEETRQLLKDAASEAESLSHLLGNLLELSRAEANRLLLYAEAISVKKVIQDTVEEMKRQSSAHQFIVDLPRKIPAVYADQLRMERILYNLLENAVKYSPQGGEIRVSVKREREHLVIGVSDQGIGISLSDQARLFGPFQRLEESRPDVGGIGLGLLVCRRLVEAHGGQIWVESKPGSGSTFFFTLPLSRS